MAQPTPFETKRKKAPIGAIERIQYLNVAEEVGFEPTVRFHARRFSRPVHSTTLPLLRGATGLAGGARFWKPVREAADLAAMGFQDRAKRV